MGFDVRFPEAQHGREPGGFLPRRASNQASNPGRPYPNDFEETGHDGSTIRRTEPVAAHD